MMSTVLSAFCADVGNSPSCLSKLIQERFRRGFPKKLREKIRMQLPTRAAGSSDPDHCSECRGVVLGTWSFATLHS